MKYNFPKSKFVTTGTKPSQINHILSEANEVNQELRMEKIDHDRVWDEVCDLLHSIETFIRMDEDAFILAKGRVLLKNKRRGYYLDPVTIADIAPGVVRPEYTPLHNILMDALKQAQDGKGSERHGQGLPFDQQPIVAIPKLQNSDIGLMYQAIKKLQESQRMDKDAATRERLGAINYIAASIIFLNSK